MPQFDEQWLVLINRKEFVLDETEKLKLEHAMKNSDRWFKTNKGDIFSVSHIETVLLHSRTIKNRLEAGNTNLEPISPEKWEKLKKNLKFVKSML